MPAKLLRATDPIEVKQIGVVLYGQPGSRKTSLAQTASKPFTFAFDPGVYRAFGRGDASSFETWDDVCKVCIDADRFRRGERPASPWESVPTADYQELVSKVAGAESLVIDTIGMGMESLAKALIEESPKNSNRQGGLSQAGYGQLASRFSTWLGSRHNNGQDVVMIAHESKGQVGEEDYYQPAVMGKKFYDTFMFYADLVGYLFFHDGKRVIDFNPSDRYMAKVPPCGFVRQALPDFKDDPKYLANLIAKAKASMGRISEDSAKVASAVQVWVDWLAAGPHLDAFNSGLPDLAGINGQAKVQAWALLSAYAEKNGWVFSKEAKVFVAREAVAS